MKILFILNMPLSIRGPSTRLFEDIFTQSNKYENLEIICLFKQAKEEKKRDNFLSRFSNIHFVPIFFKKTNKKRLVARYLYDLIFAYNSYRRYRHLNFDKVFIQSGNNAFIHMLLLKKFKKEIIYSVQDIFPANAVLAGIIKERGVTFRVLRKLQDISYKTANKIIVISDDMKDTLLKLGVNGSKIHVVYNWNQIIGSNLCDNLLVKKFRDSYKIDNGNFNIVYAGNIGVFQSVDTIIKVAKYFEADMRTIFYIIGDGVKRNEVYEKIQLEHVKNVVLVPYQGEDLVNYIYSFGNINFVTLLKGMIKTSLPSKLPAVFSYDIPIIFASDKNSKIGKEINLCKNCYSVDIDDLEDIVKKIRQIMSGKINDFLIERKDFNDHYFSRKNIDKYIDLLMDNCE